MCLCAPACVWQWWTVPVSFSRCGLYLYSTFLWRPAENQPAYQSPIEQIHCVFWPNQAIIRGYMHPAQSMHCLQSLFPKLMSMEVCYEFPQANAISISPWFQGITSALLHCGKSTADMGGEYLGMCSFWLQYVWMYIEFLISG